MAVLTEEEIKNLSNEELVEEFSSVCQDMGYASCYDFSEQYNPLEKELLRRLKKE